MQAAARLLPCPRLHFFCRRSNVADPGFSAPSVPSVLFVLPATQVGGAELRLVSMLGVLRCCRPVLLTHRALALPSGAGVERLAFEDFVAEADTPYGFGPRNILRYGRAVACAARMVKPAALFGWMHTGTLFCLAARWLGGGRRPVLGTMLGPPAAYFEAIGRTPRWHEQAVLRAVGRWPQRVVVSSRGVADEMVAGFGARRERLVCIPNGIDGERVRQLARAPCALSKQPGERWVVVLGRLSWEKGCDLALEVLARLKDRNGVRMVLIGDGPERAALESNSVGLGLQGAVVFAGGQENPFPLLAQADVFLFPSRLEGFGNALVEAMALGVPVVSSACPVGPREIVEHGVSGLLCPVGDAGALAEAVARVLEDGALAARLVEGGRARAEDYGFALMCERHDALIAGVLMGERGHGL